MAKFWDATDQTSRCIQNGLQCQDKRRAKSGENSTVRVAPTGDKETDQCRSSLCGKQSSPSESDEDNSKSDIRNIVYMTAKRQLQVIK